MRKQIYIQMIIEFKHNQSPRNMVYKLKQLFIIAINELLRKRAKFQYKYLVAHHLKQYFLLKNMAIKHFILWINKFTYNQFFSLCQAQLRVNKRMNSPQRTILYQLSSPRFFHFISKSITYTLRLFNVAKIVFNLVYFKHTYVARIF
ncbi:hypothetical protein TTHERM_000277219 (macronuclear) [Tetrahymena thermophila SB210]|uniref:Uncharacterized protein n=1 Tax=Tetrahymena thermophila (strain SB210) TaxID=312017 RepID=W7XHI7_TETTS|nr:hypothetical protein TTHERM_000277219 [Tetrahymena thermophila SB210]EWS73836.1 hypothetical protein TTHERM_000277219 [Tetrahymena thermophila SB210]|eukprot:XP_012653583.1 hypothetical protein TTHERM_000277219 [Tetrahymena thermophila SB210]